MTPVLFDLLEDFQDEFLGRFPIRRLNRRVDSEQSRIARRVGKGRDAKGESGFFAHAPVKARAAAIAENGREEIERRNIGMGDFRNMPREREPGQLRRKFLVNDARPELRRLGRDVDRLERFRRVILEESAELLIDRFRIDISHDDEGEIVRHVTRLVIPHHLLLRELVEDIQLPDHRQPVGMALKRGREKQLARHPVGIIHAHREFAPDHFLFLRVFLRREGGVHHRIGQNIEGDARAGFRHIDPVNRPIERGVGVDVAAHILDFLGDRARRRVFVPLKSMCSRMCDNPAPRCSFSSMLPVPHHACTLTTGALRSSCTMTVSPLGRMRFCAVLGGKVIRAAALGRGGF